MKINWGTAIVIFIILFFIVIFSFIYFTTTLNTNLVEEDYYPKGENYNVQWEKAHNTTLLAEKVSFRSSSDSLIISFPFIARGKNVSGSILLYRPSNNHLDVSHDIVLDDAGNQYVNTSNMVNGKYIIKIDWALEGISYYQEEVFYK